MAESSREDVRRAWSAHLVAVSVLAHLAEDDDFIQMLVDEAKIWRPPARSIARVYEFARAHGEYFIAMEHVDGKDMRTVLERCRTKKKPIPPERRVHRGEIGSALHAAHSAVDSATGRCHHPSRRVAVEHHLQLRRRGDCATSASRKATLSR